MKIKDIIILILVLLVVCMSGYLVYDKLLSDNTVNTDEEIKEENIVNEYVNGKMDDYKSADGSYGIVESFLVESPDYLDEEWYFFVKLSLDGKVYIYDRFDRDVVGVVSGLNNVVDVFEYRESFGDVMSSFYFLTSDGYIYKSSGYDFVAKKYIASKMDGISNVKRIIDISNCYEQACINSTVAVTNDEDYIKLSSISI